jgi:hypothetical protein
MSGEGWKWDTRKHPRVVGVLADSTFGEGWCDKLETAATDAAVGKMLCVCAAAAIARKVADAERLAKEDPQQAVDALDLLGSWIDGPSDERFERICALIFPQGGQPVDPMPPRVAWWALRTATSSVGNSEAGWALEATCDAAASAGFTPQELLAIVKQELFSRRSRRD